MDVNNNRKCSCGRDILGEDINCGFCGIERESDDEFYYRLWMSLSILFAYFALTFVPPLLGGIGIYLGHKVKKIGRKRTGTILMIVNGICIIAGMFLGGLFGLKLYFL